MRRGAGFVLGAAIALALTVPFASAAASTGEPAPGATSAVGVGVTIPTTPGPTPTPSNHGGGGGGSGGGGGGGGGGSSTPDPVPSAPPTCANTDAEGKPSAPDVPGSPSADAGEATITPDQASPGDSVTVVAQGFAPGEQVEAVIYSQATALGSEAATADGAISMVVKLPADTSVGNHTLQLLGWTSCVAANGPLFVVSQAGSGESVFPWIVWVIVGAAVALAAILFVAARLLGWHPFRRAAAAGSVS